MGRRGSCQPEAVTVKLRLRAGQGLTITRRLSLAGRHGPRPLRLARPGPDQALLASARGVPPQPVPRIQPAAAAVVVAAGGCPADCSTPPSA